jgi:GT2 family glycosyltransferase
VGTQSVIFSSSKDNLIDSSIAGHPQRPLDYEEIVAKDAKNKVVMVYASMMIKREVQKAIGFFDENLERGEDYEYISRAIKLGIKVGNSPSKLYAYRHRKFDRYTQFKTDNSVRGVKNYLVLRFLLNCLYRGVNLPLEKGIKREWQDIFVRTSLLVDNHGLFKRFLERK